MNEAEQQIRTMSQTRETAMQHHTHLLHVRRRGIPQPGFDVAMTILFRVQLGRMRGQPLDADFRLIRQEGGDYFALMDRRRVPDQDEPFRQIAQHMAQGHDDFCAAHGFIELSRVDVSRQSQAHRHRQGAAFIRHAPQNRALALGRPRGRQRLPKGEPELIKEHDFYAVPPRLFLSWANHVPARPGSTLHRAPRHAPMESADSSRAGGAGAEGSDYDS